MTKHVASFIPNFWSPHLEIDFDIVKEHIESGDSVRLFVCNGELTSCYGNPTHSLDLCRWCVNRRRNALEDLGLTGSVQLEGFLDIAPEDLDLYLKFRGVKIESTEQLLQFRIDNFELGKAIYNEICSHVADTEIDYNEHQAWASGALDSGAAVYLSFKNRFKTYRPDCFYTFNGRFVVSRAAITAAINAGIPYALHDRAWRLNYYTLIRNESLHSLDYWQRRADSAWARSNEPESAKIATAEAWFETRIAGANPTSFTSDQDVPLPASFDNNKVNVVIFNTSEYETVGLEDYRLPIYEGQNQAIERIAKDLLGDDQVQLYLRVHPNLKGCDNVQSRDIKKRLTDKISNLEVIPAESKIRTYNLMRNADLVITFGSTTGIEAAYLGTPSVLLGPATYGRLDACFLPESHEELLEFISQRKFKLSDEERARRKINALKYAYFGLTHGEQLKYFQQVSFKEVHFAGKPIDGEARRFDAGLLDELKERVELRPDANPNPLSGALKQAVDLSISLSAENERLKAELAEAHKSALQQKPIVDSVHRLTSLGRSVKHRIKRFL
jgi:hypothetical protein